MKTWFNKLKEGLSKTSNKINEGISNIFTKSKLDKETITELEELLLSSDIGIEATSKIIDSISKDRFDKEITIEQIKIDLTKAIENLIVNLEKPLDTDFKNGLNIVLVCGVNGNGKTTTIGKLANYYKHMGKKVAVAACDTFRAAAVSQLKIWAERANIKFISGNENADPASVAYEAVEAAIKEEVEILFIDTAGRLHNKSNLMEELSKIVRVIKKLDPDAPHQTILVVDATTGQNANLQVENFNKAVNLTGLVITKLDGTARAGVLINLSYKYKLPVVAIGVGEGIEDLRPFNAQEFAMNLIGVN
ncbi:MAG: signal recognition particle-docking protein FtsY [Alphaproteobacteria bacterium]